VSTNQEELAEARDLYSRKAYRQVLSLLAPQIFIYRSDVDYFFLMALSSLRVLDFSGALSYFLRGADLNPQHQGMLEGLALCHMLNKEETEAARIWLYLLEIYPQDSKAKQGLRLLKEKDSKIQGMDLFKSPEIQRLIPRAPLSLKKYRLPGLILISALLVLSLGGFLLNQFLSNRQEASEKAFNLRMSSNNQSTIDLSARETYKDFSYELPEEEISQSTEKELMAELKAAFNQYSDNKARFLINRLLLSTASQNSKTQAESIIPYLKEPRFTNFKDPVEYQDVLKTPWLYQDSYVRWSGKISNYAEAPDQLSFDLLLNYHNKPIAEGSVPVKVNFPVELYNDMDVELIGQVKNSLKLKGEFTLHCTSIRLIRGSKE